MRDKNKKQFGILCQTRIKRELENQVSQLTQSTFSIQRLQSQLINFIRAENVAREQIAILTQKCDDTSRYEQEYDKILQLPEIDRIEAAYSIHLFTKEIDIEFNNRVYAIGKYDIALPVDNYETITCSNITNKVLDYDHPHILNSTPCLGTASIGILKMIANYEFYLAIEFILAFLKTVNVGDWYTHINQWPVKEVLNNEQ